MKAVTLLFFFLSLIKFSFAGDSLFVYGTITAKETGEKFYKAVVYDTSAKVGAYTDKEGFYKLYIPKELYGKGLILNFKYVGYDLLKRRVRIAKQSKQLNIHLSPMVQYIEAM